MLHRHRLVFICLAALLATCFGLSASVICRAAITIETVPIDNPGNSSDPATGYGGVPYSYRIGKFDVTNAQYAEFLNSKDPTGANYLKLWSNGMAIPGRGGIDLDAGNTDGSKYVLIPGAQDHPVNYVTWYGAIRFANWLNNGQGNGDTETGAYTLLHDRSPIPIPIPSNGLIITRNAGAKEFLPSENEWYKAAYFNPLSSSYFQYPMSSDTTPISSTPTSLPNHVNYNNAVGGPSDVGAYAGTSSPYGAFDMGGSVFQWNEALVGDSYRSLRGGSFDYDSSYLLSSFRGNGEPDFGNFNSNYGFRVATIPEPITAMLAIVACGMICCLKRTSVLTTSPPPAPD